jgi:hypothetical protein
MLKEWCANLSLILEWQRPIQMVSHKTYNLNAQLGFCKFLTSKLRSSGTGNNFQSGLKKKLKNLGGFDLGGVGSQASTPIHLNL